MADEKKADIDSGKTEEENEDKRSFTDLIRNVVLAGVGAVVATQEEIKEFVGILVEKGELAETEGKKLVRDFLERRKKKTRETVDEVENQLESRIDRSLERVLHSISIPTRRDVQQLHQKVDTLADRFDRLQKALDGRAKGRPTAKASG